MEHIEISVPDIETKERILWLLEHFKSDGVQAETKKQKRNSSGKALTDFLDDKPLIDAFKNIKDPVKWQREIRKDRKLLKLK